MGDLWLALRGALLVSYDFALFSYVWHPFGFIFTILLVEPIPLLALHPALEYIHQILLQYIHPLP